MFRIRLKELRLENGWTQQQLADKLGIPKNTLAGYELGPRSPKYEVVKDLAVLFNTSVDYLFGIVDDRHPRKRSDNIAKVLREKDYHYNGVPLDEDDLEALIGVLDRIANYKQPKKEDLEQLEKHKEHNHNHNK